MTGGTGLAQVAQHAEDLDRAAAFYERLLGAPPLARFDPPGLLFFGLGRRHPAAPRGRRASSAMLYLPGRRRPRPASRSSAPTAWPSRPSRTSSSATPTTPSGRPGSDEWMAFIRDSEGNLVGLVSHAPRAEA